VSQPTPPRASVAEVPTLRERRGRTHAHTGNYPQLDKALGGVDLDLFEGEFLVLLGPSGSGKSTLNILGGLDVPSSGTVRYRDHTLTDADERTLTSTGASKSGSCSSSTT